MDTTNRNKNNECSKMYNYISKYNYLKVKSQYTSMSLYISLENQTLLWNTIQQIQLLHDQIPAYKQQEWFKQIIGSFYQNNKGNTYVLHQLNKDTIQYMIKSLKPEPHIETKINETIHDTAIENMEELLHQHMNQRDLDLQPPDIVDLRRIVKQLQQDVALLKKSISETKEVTE